MSTTGVAEGQRIPLSSPSFEGQGDHCLSFHYKLGVPPLGLVNAPAPRLEVYIRTSKHVYSGWELWTSNGTGQGHAQISVRTRIGWLYRISFVGVVGHPTMTSISVANIQLRHGNCMTSKCEQTMCEFNHSFNSNCKLRNESQSAVVLNSR